MGDASPLITVTFDTSAHDATSFSCGEADLDKWIRKQAATARAGRVAQTFVWIDDEVVVDASTERGRQLYEQLGFTPVRGHVSRMIARAETLEEGVATLLR